jgi:bud site selection protein 31
MLFSLNQHYYFIMSSKKWNKKKTPPPGFEVIEPVLEALEAELRDRVKESNANKRKTEAMWPIHQINWQKSRYVYDMYYTYHRITKQVYDYCISQKLVDAPLIAKWKKPGYERLCSTYVINPTNYKFGTTSICRVPWKDRSDEQKKARDPTTGCMGCASSSEAGQPRNIFGNKYGQNLAAVQVAREKRMKELERMKAEQAAARAQQDDDEGDEETDDETDDDDYGPSPAAGVWAGSQKLQAESEVIAENDEEADDGDNDNDDDDDDGERPNKKVRTD